MGKGVLANNKNPLRQTLPCDSSSEIQYKMLYFDKTKLKVGSAVWGKVL